MPSSDRALAATAPPVTFSRTLEAATSQSMVLVDRRGRVVSPTWHRVRTAVTVAAAAWVPVGLAIGYGIAGAVGGAALVGVVGWEVWLVRRVNLAVRLLIAGRTDDAEAVLSRVVTRRCPRRIRAVAEQNLAVCAARRGDHASALEHQRTALRLYAARAFPGPAGRTVQYAEIRTLVNLGRVAEARALLAQRHPAEPTGELFRMHHWVAELYVALAEGRHDLDADVLHARARVALGITLGRGLLGLLAWAHHAAGDDDQARHLLREAMDRDGEPLPQAMPLLHAWIEAQRAAGALDEPDPYADL